MTYNICSSNIHIKDSYLISKEDYDYCLDYIHKDKDYARKGCVVMEQRSRCSLKNEWAAHTLLYDLGIERERTKDADLNVPQEWYVKVAYAVLGTIARVFIK